MIPSSNAPPISTVLPSMPKLVELDELDDEGMGLVVSVLLMSTSVFTFVEDAGKDESVLLMFRSLVLRSLVPRSLLSDEAGGRFVFTSVWFTSVWLVLVSSFVEDF